MSVIGLIGSLLILLILLIWVMRPLWRISIPATDQSLSERERIRAHAYYERVLTNIRDLDEDKLTGKISEEEYQKERTYWLDRGIRVLKVIEKIDAKEHIVSTMNADDAMIDQNIESAIQSTATE